MFGSFSAPYNFSAQGLELSFTKTGTAWTYRRSIGEQVVTQVISEEPKGFFHPIEPLMLPKPVATALQIEFEQPFTLGPMGKAVVFLSFPVEMGVFLTQREGSHMIDVLTLAQPKLTLYGKAPEGILCRFHRSPLSFETPALDPLRLGVLRLALHNTEPRWVTVTQTVLSAQAMKLFFNDALVGMSATMKILDRDKAEVEGTVENFAPGMTPGHEAYPLKRLNPLGRKLQMEEGI